MSRVVGLLLTNGCLVVGEFNDYYSIAHHLGISIDEGGQITFMGNAVHPTYAMKTEFESRNRWEPHDALSDWAKTFMEKNLPADFKIYRYTS